MWFKPQAPIVLDCDGVILGFDHHFPVVAQHALGRNEPLVRVNNEYNLALRYGLSKQELARVFDVFMEHDLGWRGLPLLEGADAVIADLRARGHAIHMVTGIDETHKELRLQNLLTYGIEVDAIHCVGVGHSSKEQVIRQIQPIAFVDDRLRLLRESSFVPHKVFIDHGDTQDGHEPGDDVHVCKSLAQWHAEVYLPTVSSKPRKMFAP